MGPGGLGCCTGLALSRPVAELAYCGDAGSDFSLALRANSVHLTWSLLAINHMKNDVFTKKIVVFFCMSIISEIINGFVNSSAPGTK